MSTQGADIGIVKGPVSMSDYAKLMFTPLLIVLSCLFTLSIVSNGSSGEQSVSDRLKVYLPLYTIGCAILCYGLLVYFHKYNNPFLLYSLVFFAYASASFAMFVASESVAISLT
jgi:hypothetical protein